MILVKYFPLSPLVGWTVPWVRHLARGWEFSWPMVQIPEESPCVALGQAAQSHLGVLPPWKTLEMIDISQNVTGWHAMMMMMIFLQSSFKIEIPTRKLEEDWGLERQLWRTFNVKMCCWRWRPRLFIQWCSPLLGEADSPLLGEAGQYSKKSWPGCGVGIHSKSGRGGSLYGLPSTTTTRKIGQWTPYQMQPKS